MGEMRNTYKNLVGESESRITLVRQERIGGHC
jgi:hypothetical protein